MTERLEEHLVAQGRLAPERAEDALRSQALVGGAMDTVLLELGAVSEADVVRALGEVSGLQPIHLADYVADPAMARVLPLEDAERLNLAPLSDEEGLLHVAVPHPVPMRGLEGLVRALGRSVAPWVATDVRVRAWRAQVYGTPLGARETALLAALAAPGRGRGARATPAMGTDAVPTPPAGTPEVGEALAPSARPASPTEDASLPSVGAALRDDPEALDLTLEERLLQEMAESAAKAVAGEPVPLLARARPDADAADGLAGSLLEALEAGVAAAEPDLPAWAARDEAAVATGLPTGAARAPAAPDAPEGPDAREPGATADATAAANDVGPDALQDRATPGRPAPDAPDRSLPPPRLAPASRTPTAGARSREPVVEWTLAEARNALRAVAGDREGIKDVVLRYARGTFDFVSMFAVVRGTALGWDARGEGADGIALAQLSFPLDVPSAFRIAAFAHASWAGPVPGDALTAQVLGALGRRPRSLFVHPVEVRGRLVALVYGDRGARPVSRRRLSDLILFCQELGSAFAELIVLRKQRRFPEPEPAPADDDGPPGSPADGTVALSGRAPPTVAPALAPAGRPAPPPPSDLGPVLAQLVGADATARASAIGELARAPDAAARALVARFPGPSAWSRVEVQELPEPDELGPVPAALARLGPAGARALARLLDAAAPDVRYVALLTAGSLPYAELVPGVLRGLFDDVPEVASAARAAATALRRLPRLQRALPELRQELAAVEPARRIAAARALGALHDRASVEGLIGLTASDDARSAAAAADALAEVTRASFGTDTHAWMAWWAENRTHRRAQWLLAALRNPDPALRAAAIDELAAATGDPLGFVPDGPALDREAAVRRWEDALLDPRLRALD